MVRPIGGGVLPMTEAPFCRLPEYSIIPDIHPVRIKAALVAASSCPKSDQYGWIPPVRPPVSEADRLRLVEAAKSPTSPDQLKWRATIQADALLSRGQPAALEVEPEHQPMRAVVDPETGAETATANPYSRAPGAGRFAVLYCREWSGEWRIRTETELASKPPKGEGGPRESENLSERGARKIAESCYYVAKRRRGFSTFLTLTLDDAARARVAAGETTIQAEVSRFFDGAQKMYQRGWVAELPAGKVKVPGSARVWLKAKKRDQETDEGAKYTAIKRGREPLDYIWVAENPKNDKGEDNPHIHVMMRWRVPYRLFKAWAARMESLWGHGFAHLEKIREPENAGAYLSKAAGYLSKAAGQNDQGTITGNRYGISDRARAPEWGVWARWELDIMGGLVAHLAEHLRLRFGHIRSRRNQLKRELEKTTDKARRADLGRALEEVRKRIEKMPAASRYQVILKGREQLDAFLGWAKERGAVENHAWLPEKPAGFDFRPVRGLSRWTAEARHTVRVLHEYRERRRMCGYLEETRQPGYWSGLVYWAERSANDESEDERVWRMLA